MPIIGLTDTVAPSFPRLGKLRKGGEKEQHTKNGKTYEVYGKDLPYFRFTANRPEIAEAFRQAYGEQPASLAVYLPYTTVEQNFSTWKEKWVRGGLEHRCDGVTMIIWQENGKYLQAAKPCPYKDDPDHKDACKEVGRLTIILPELWRAGFVGYVTMETHGRHDIINIQASLLATLETRGDNPMGLRGIEFTLRRSMETISAPGDRGRVSRDKYLVRLEPMATWASLQLQAAQQAAMGLLPSPRTIDQATGEIVEDIEPPEDVEDAEFTEQPKPPKQEPQRQAQQEPAKMQRPYEPEMVRNRVRELVAQGATAAASQGYAGSCVGLLDSLFPDDDQDTRTAKRHTLSTYLLNKGSSKEWTAGEVAALLKWARNNDDSTPSPDATIEAARIVHQYEQEAP